MTLAGAVNCFQVLLSIYNAITDKDRREHLPLLAVITLCFAFDWTAGPCVCPLTPSPECYGLKTTAILKIDLDQKEKASYFRCGENKRI
jgi:hypothetical protein